MAFSSQPAGSSLEDHDVAGGPAEPPRRVRRLTPAELATFKGRRAVPIGLGLTAVAACTYAVINDPNQSSAYPQCPFKAMTGLDCPGCGLTRGVYSLLHGRALEALDHNILLLLIVPIFVYMYAVYVARAFGWELPALRFPRWFAPVLAVFVLAYWVVRNVPGPLHRLDSLAG